MPIEEFAPALSTPVLTSQHWAHLTFLHWPVAPALVAHLFPVGTRPDVVDGVTYVGLVPFVMAAAGPGPVPVPYFGRFGETNVRLYSVDDRDRHGIVFLTLEASRLATVLLARVALGLPYTWSAMSARRAGDEVDYLSVRRWPDRAGHARSAVTVVVGRPTRPTPLEIWLTSRWGLHTRVLGRTIWVPNQHGPWPLHEARLRHLDRQLVGACGVEVDDTEMLRPLWTPGVRTTFGPPVRVAG